MLYSSSCFESLKDRASLLGFLLGEEGGLGALRLVPFAAVFRGGTLIAVEV